MRHTLVRHGLAHDATVTSSAASFRHSQRGRTQVVSCQVSFVLTFTGHQPGVAMKSAKVKGSGTVTSRRRLPLALAKEKCAVTVAKELASTRARRFLVRHSTSWFAQATVE